MPRHHPVRPIIPMHGNPLKAMGGRLALACEEGIETLRPNAPGDECNLPGEVGAPCPNHYLNVDEETPDDALSYNYNDTGVWLMDLYHHTPHVQGCGIITEVTFFIRVRGTGLIRPEGRHYLKTYDTLYYLAPFEPQPTWMTTYLNTSSNPHTGMPWTWPEVDDLQVGVALLKRALSGIPMITQMYIEVHYGPGS